MWNQIVYQKPTSLKELQDLCFCDLMMLRMQKVFREMKISFSDEKFAKSILFNWHIENHSMTGTTTRQGEAVKRGLRKPLPPRTYITGIYKSKNRLKSFLKCEDRWCPTDEQYKQLAKKLGYMEDDEIAKLEALKIQFPDASNKDFKVKRMFDLLPHLKPGASHIGLLESAGYFRKELDGSYSPTGKAHQSPRVKMWEAYKEDQNKQYEKLRDEAARIEQNSKVDKSKNRLSNLKNFFGISKWEGKQKEGDIKI